MDKFKIGDVVRLKSGSVKMTIVSIPQLQNYTVRCSWYNSKDGHIVTEVFHQDSLQTIRVSK